MATQEQIAKQLLAKRIEIENSAISMINTEIERTFRKLIDLGYAEDAKASMFRFSDMSNKSISELKKILSYLRTYIYMVATHSMQSAIDIVENEYGIAEHLVAEEFANKEQFGKTTKERIGIYVNHFKFEAEAWIAAGLVLGLKKYDVTKEFKTYANKPYANPVFREASKLESKASRLKRGAPNFGIGKYTSAVNAITRLERGLVGEMYRQTQILAWNANTSVVGYRVARGSSFPCQLCDDMVGFHKDSIDLPSYHLNCRCIVWAVYSNEEGF